VDSIWSFLSFETNLQVLIFTEPTSYYDTLMLRVSPYQVVSRVMVVTIFIISGVVLYEFLRKKQRAEAALSESEEKYKNLVEHANDAIFIAQDGYIKFPNPKTYEITGYSENDFEKIPFHEMIHSDDRELVVQRHKERLEGENPPSTYSFRVVTSKNKVKWVQLNTAAITWDGRPATLNIVRDITREKMNEASLQQSQKLEAVGTLVGGVAHDFKNILSIILGNIHLALDDVPKSHPARFSLDEINTASLRAEDIVRQLLSFSRKSEVKKEPLKIHSIVEESIRLLRASIPTTIKIQTDIQGDAASINADPTQIHQVLINLCTNAAHAMEEKGGVLSLGVMERNMGNETNDPYPDLIPGRYVQLTVCDNGTGIDPKNMDRIFDPYFTTKEPGKGTGMGLAVVHGIVKNHDGVISIDSEPGKGTSVKILFPAIKEESVPENLILKELPKGNERILFIDDEESIVAMAHRILERLGYHVEGKTDSVKALELFRSDPDRFDLIITDMTMPGLTGDHLVREAMTIRGDMPIILCTGLSEKINGDKVRKMGIKKYLEKPLKKYELSQAVREALDGN
jgi:PAS domain S-box-containing protein